jgi:hypothetical protein
MPYGGCVLFNSTTYYVSGVINLKSGISLVGTGKEIAVINSSAATANGVEIATDVINVKIERINIYNRNSGTGTGIKCNENAVNIKIDDVAVGGFLVGIDFQEADSVQISNCALTGQGAAVAGGIGVNLGNSGSALAVNSASLKSVAFKDYLKGYSGDNAADVVLDTCSFTDCGQPIETASEAVAISARYDSNDDGGEHIKYLAGGKATTVDCDGIANTAVDQLVGYDITEHSDDAGDRGEFNFYKNHADSSTKSETVDNESIGIIRASGVPTGAADWSLMASIEFKQDGAAGAYNKGEIELSVGSATETPTVQAKVSDATAAGDTGLFISHNDGSDKSLRRVTVGPIDSGAAGYRALQVANDSTVVTVDNKPVWRKFTIGFADLQNASLTKDILLLNLVAKGIVHAVAIKHSTAFSGTGITGLTVSIGKASDTSRYATAYDIFQAAGDTVFQFSNSGVMENFTDATVINAYFIGTGANLIQLAAGSVDIWVLSSTLI